MLLKRHIAYTYSWRHTLYIGVIIGLLLAAILIFLQPFDTYQSNMPHKNLKLGGYALCILLPMVFLHGLENYWFRRQGDRWRLWNEALIMIVQLLLGVFSAYLYNAYLVSGFKPSWKNGLEFFLYFGLPFSFFLLPIWIYLRYTFGTLTVVEKAGDSKLIMITGENNDDRLELDFRNFVLAQAQQNYVDLYYLDDQGVVHRKVIRSTLSSLLDQMPQAYQVHRSFVLNLTYVRLVKGNTRKRFAELETLDWDVPISQKYYQAIERHLQNRPGNR